MSARRVDFWSRVHKTDGCWLWTLKPRSDAYGRLGKRSVPAHRLSWEIHNGPIPPGICVLHHCDTRLYVRPDHLFLGTVADNNKDRDRKERGRKPHSVFKPGPLNPRWNGGVS
jgi:hypothetical protein